jgi:preprotein translocase SecE subunit
MVAKQTVKKRVRKSAPTIRERAVTASQPSSPSTPKRFAANVTAPIKKFHLPKNPITPVLLGVARGVKKVLSWLIPRYFVNAWREVRLVTWPGRSETRRLTTAVFIFAAVFGIVAAIVDKGLDVIFKKLVLK